MKLKQANMLMISTVVLMASIAPLTVSAADAYADSKAKVNFTGAGEEPTPVDPTTPTHPKPLEPDNPLNPVHPGTIGALRYDRVPVLNFGESKILGETIYPEVHDDDYQYRDSTLGKFYAAPTVQITDVRGSNKGWTASISASSFEAYDKVTGEKIENSGLEKAVVNFNEAKVASLSGIEETNYAPVFKPGLALNSSPQTFAGAKAGTGMGKWGISFVDDENSQNNYPIQHDKAGTTNKAVTLTIPATAQKNKDYTYNATLTWAISSEPSND